MPQLFVSPFQNSTLRFVLACITLIISLASVSAQGVGSSRGLPGGSGRHTVKGRVYGPTGRPAEAGLKLRLESDSAASNATATTDQDGTFIFTNVSAGTYTLVIEATGDHDAAREPVTVYGAASGPQSVNVAISLKARGAAAALAKIPKDARESYNKGMEAAAKGENQKAAELLDRAVTLHADFPQALTELGLQYMKLGQMAKAVQTYEALIKIKPTDATAFLNLGIALYNQSTALLSEKKLEESNQNLSNSENYLRQSAKLNKASAWTHYYLGLILIRQRKYADAQKEMEMSIASGGENLALAHKYLGGLYMSAKKNKEAADELEKYLQLDPKAKDSEQIRATIKDLRAKL